MTTIVDETYLREPNLWVPGKKPIGPVKIDWEHPLTSKLRFYVIIRGSIATELVTNVSVSANPIGNGAVKAYAEGLGWATNSSTVISGFQFPYNKCFDIVSNEFTVGILYAQSAFASGDRSIMGLDDSSTLLSGHWKVGTTQNTRELFSVHNGTDWVSSISGLSKVFVSNKILPYGYTIDSASTRKYYSPLERALVAGTSVTHPTSGSGSGTFSIGHLTSTNFTNNSVWFGAFGYDRALPLKDWLSIHDDPYQMLAPS